MLGLEKLGLLGLFLGNLLAATVIPFSSDALYIAVLAMMKEPVACFAVATAGNWLGSVVTYYMGRLGRWEWIEKEKIDRWGVWLALIAWVPFIGDVFVIALGFYRTRQIPTIVLLLIGKALRFLAWTMLFIR